MINRIIIRDKSKSMINSKSSLYLLIVFLISSIAIGGFGYFLFTQQGKHLLFKHAPGIYWKTQKERKDVKAPQVSGRIVRKEKDGILVINSARGNTLDFSIPSNLKILKFSSGMKKEEISFEEIKEGDYVLILPSLDSFYEDEKTAQEIFVSSLPIFSKVETYEKG